MITTPSLKLVFTQERLRHYLKEVLNTQKPNESMFFHEKAFSSITVDIYQKNRTGKQEELLVYAPS